MSETIEIVRDEEIREVQETAAKLMDKAESFGRKKALRSGEIAEVGKLLGMEEEVVASVLVKFLYDRKGRHREAALLVLAHPEFDLGRALSSKHLVNLRDQVIRRVFWMAENDQAKRVRSQAAVLAEKLAPFFL